MHNKTNRDYEISLIVFVMYSENGQYFAPIFF